MLLPVAGTHIPITTIAPCILPPVVALLFGACATAPSRDARRIVETDPSGVSNCRYIKEVHGSSGWGGLAASTGIENAKNEALDEAAEAGATHVVWSSLVGGFGPSASGKAYGCAVRSNQVKPAKLVPGPPTANPTLSARPAIVANPRVSAGPTTLPVPSTGSTRRSGIGLAGTCATYLGVGSGHWMTEKTDDGAVVILEDGSIWQIDPMDRLDTSLWLPPSEIAVIETNNSPMSYLLVNTDDGEKATACLLSTR
jgi:hypothetical protein